MIDMQDELSRNFGREVDLVERKAVERSENYIRRRHICNPWSRFMWRDEAYLLDMLLAA